MTDLAEFLRARIAEDEEIARRAGDAGCGLRWSVQSDEPTLKAGLDTWVADIPMSVWTCDDELDGCPEMARRIEYERDHMGRHDPARVLAECESKRRIIEAYRVEHTKARPQLPNLIALDTPAGGTLGWTLKCLALPYADHPQYDESWRP